MTSVVYPGSFNPITYGHQDIVERALGLFDKVIVAVGTSSDKDPSTYLADRIHLCRAALAEFGDRVEVDGFNVLLVDYVRSKDTRFIVRGLRTISDFDYEYQMITMNREMDPRPRIRPAAHLKAMVVPVLLARSRNRGPRRQHRRVRPPCRGGVLPGRRPLGVREGANG